MKKWIYVLCLFFTFSVYAAEKITVLAAASLTNVLDQIKTEYLKTHPETEINLVFASSSTLARQIEQGAPADIFVSADQKWMDYLVAKHLVGNKKILVNNELVWIAQKNYGGKINLDPEDLSKWINNKTKIAIGDPSHVPAGIYAKQALTSLHLYDLLSSHFVTASNVREALMYVELGEADFGIVYATDAKVSQKVKTVLSFPQSSYPKIEYPMALINPKAEQFYHYLASKSVQNIFEQHGFLIPKG